MLYAGVVKASRYRGLGSYLIPRQWCSWGHSLNYSSLLKPAMFLLIIADFYTMYFDDIQSELFQISSLLPDLPISYLLE